MNAPTSVAAIGCVSLEEFIVHEARLLDERRFRDWMALFAEDGTYWVPAMPDQRNPFDQASLFYGDRELMRTRIKRLEHPRIHVQTPPSRTAHLVGNVLVESVDEGKGEYVVGSTVIMVEYRDEQQRVFAGRSIIACAATARAFASCRSASTSSIAILPSRRWPCRFSMLSFRGGTNAPPTPPPLGVARDWSGSTGML